MQTRCRLHIKVVLTGAIAFLLLAPARLALAQEAGIGLDPGRLEVEVRAGQEKTVSFQIESPPALQPVRGRLLLTLSDWSIGTDTSVTFAQAGTLSDSAAGWIVFSPSSATITSGQRQLVRVTIKVPADAPPGVYRSGILVQERPPAAPPEPGQNRIFFRFRYLFSLYVIVPPVSGLPEATDLQVLPETNNGVRVICEMKNKGTRHVRPYITWILRDEAGNERLSVKDIETTVLLPKSTIREPMVLQGFEPGNYEIEALVDFRNGGPLESLKTAVQIPARTQ